MGLHELEQWCLKADDEVGYKALITKSCKDEK